MRTWNSHEEERLDVDNTVARSVPVFGRLLLVVENRRIQDETVDGKIYFNRDLPQPSGQG